MSDNPPTAGTNESSRRSSPANKIERGDRPHVLLIVETSMAFGRSVLEGISRYLVQNPPWSVQLDLRELLATPPAWLRDWEGDGIITRSTTPQMAELISQWGIPTVNLTDVFGDQGLPSVLNDHEKIGRVAAQHLMAKGLTRFGYCGFADHDWSSIRLAGFRDELQKRGFFVDDHSSDWSHSRQVGWGAQQSELVQWIDQLPKPVGVMACNDFRGQHVLEACQANGMSVPDEIAVVGVDNDHVLCDFCNPPLSSVMPAAERIGFEAAGMLDQLMRGESIPSKRLLIEPLGVAERQSTEVLAIDDVDIVAALQMIRDQACAGLTVGDILKEVPLARSSLERRFRKLVGRSPQAEIRAVQVKRACQLLLDTDLNLTQIATLTGFKHSEYFSVVFKREVGKTPGNYRHTSR
ncbi:XylR family transcriptional regulator [Stieleria marina]|uniref:Xylose operon regulatory protein n=1 Tax=Stieleria marina TaxID=1930275 RepID=A0A517NQ32_9BACT|nr:Xylose operon regulatory protein [Planctomycetes bacterium K23_9]